MMNCLRNLRPKIMRCFILERSCKQSWISWSCPAISRVVRITGRSVSCPPVSRTLRQSDRGRSIQFPFLLRRNLTICSIPLLVNVISSAWSVFDHAPVSILAKVGSFSNSGRPIHSRQPRTVLLDTVSLLSPAATDPFSIR